MKTKQETMTIKGTATSIGVTPLAMLINAYFEDGQEIKLEVAKDDFIKTLVEAIGYQERKAVDEDRVLSWRDIRDFDLGTYFVIRCKAWSGPRIYVLQRSYKNGNNHFKQFKTGRSLIVKRDQADYFTVTLFNGEIG